MQLVSSYAPWHIWLCDRVMRFQSKTHISPLLAIESPVAQITEGRRFKSHLELRFFWVNVSTLKKFLQQFLSARQNDRRIRDRNQRQGGLWDISENIIWYFFADGKTVEADLRINEFQVEFLPPMYLVPSNCNTKIGKKTWGRVFYFLRASAFLALSPKSYGGPRENTCI